MASVKTLGESDEDDDAAAWVNKNREIQKQKEEASKRVSHFLHCWSQLSCILFSY